MQAVFLIAFTLFWSGITLFFDGMVTQNIYKQYESASYPSVTGKVTHSEVQTSRGSKGGTSYSAKITYVYQVNGQSFTGDKLRFNQISTSSAAQAKNSIRDHPVGADTTVYYNPSQPEEAVLSPGVKGGDFMLVLFLTPFNAVMLGFWVGLSGWLRERLFRPVAGGVKIIDDKMYVRIRLPEFGAFGWALVISGGLGFISMFIIGFGTGMNPSMPVIFSAIALVYGAGLAAYLRQWQKINSGIDDLVINESSRTLELPLTFGRKAKVTVPASDIQSIWVETVTHRSNKGGVSYTYAPTLRLPKSEPSFQKLADWSDKTRADDFAAWLAQKLGVVKE